MCYLYLDKYELLSFRLNFCYVGYILKLYWSLGYNILIIGGWYEGLMVIVLKFGFRVRDFCLRFGYVIVW